MRSLGLDIGGRRTGVAISDPQGILATPLTVLDSKDEDALIDEIIKLVKQHEVACVIVGLPRRLNGEIGKQAGKVTSFAEELLRQAKLSNLDRLDVQLWDERLSTKAAERLKTEASGQGIKPHSRAKRGARNHRFPLKAKVDAIAAAIILQGFLDSHRQSNKEGQQAMPRYIGLIGYSLKHSISPYFQQAALDYYRLDIRYEVWETSPARLQDTVNDLRKPQNVGANVTTPHKETVLPLLDEVDDLARSIGAVNTIVKKDDKLVGFNTDAYGFIEALEKEGHFDPEGKRVVILGAGGAGRAVASALVQRKVASLAITDGIFERARTLAESLATYIERASLHSKDSKPDVTAFQWQNLNSPKTFAHCNLIVHCTTIGMKYSSQEGQSPLSLEVIPKNILVYDIVYNPWPTPLLRLAQKAGANILGGLPMLVYQGAASFKLWTGKEAPIDIMFNKAKEILTGGKP